MALASAKQSRRAVVPEIRTPLSFDTYLDEPAGALRLMLVEPDAHADVEPLAALEARTGSRRRVGLDRTGRRMGQGEWKAARDRGVRLISLGQRTLRADAVPVAVVSVLSFLWEQ